MDAACWANRRGYGRFAREIVGAMAREATGHEFIAFGDTSALAMGPSGLPNLTPVAVRQGSPAATAAAAAGFRSPVDMLRLAQAVRQERPDVFFSPSVYTWFPLPPGQRAVVTIHDTIAERFPDLTLPGRRARLFWTLKVRLALAQSRLVLTVSEYAARQVEANLGVARGRLRIALEAPSRAYHPPEVGSVDLLRARLGLPDGTRWFSYVGGFSPHKRLDVALRALASARHQLGPETPHLVLAGRRDGDVFLSHVGGLDHLVAALGLSDLVHWPGFLPDHDLRALHGGAVAALLPSASEGFGLPAVEAAACGTPVLATRESPLPELLAGGGIFVTPGDVGELAAAMLAVARGGEARAAMGDEARRRAGALSWAAGAQAALGALEEAAA